jgi:sugar transferase (PEP-CTERM/EpsH1 system associated)
VTVRKRIVHVIYRLQSGGMENGLVNLVNSLPEDEHQHDIICVTNSTDFARRIRATNVRIHELCKRPGKDLGVYIRFWRLIRKISPDIVHTRNLGTVDFSVVAAVAGVPVRIHSEHGWDIADPAGVKLKYRLLRKLCNPAITLYIAVSNDIRSWLCQSVGIPERKILHICNGVDTAAFRPDGQATKWPIPDDALVIGTVGRLDPIKDLATLIESVARIVKEHAKDRLAIHLVIIGQGALESELRRLAEDRGIGDLVIFAGQRDDLPCVYRSMHIFVLASLNEGISNTILEAMASGLPIVVTDVGGNGELISDRKTGLVVPARDVVGLSAAVREYIQDAKLREAHGLAARERAEQQFALDSMIQRYRDVYGNPVPQHQNIRT